MTKKDLLSVASKVLGLYLIVISLNIVIMSISTGISSFNYYMAQQGVLKALFEFLRVLLVFIPLSLYFIGAYILIKKSDIVADKLCRNDVNEELKINLEKKDLIDFAFVLVGIGSIGRSLLELVIFFSNLANKLNYGAEFAKHIWPQFFEFLVLFLFGLLLVFGSRRLTDFIEKIRK
jgi:hypothetical protein